VTHLIRPRHRTGAARLYKRAAEHCVALGLTLSETAYVFSYEVDGSVPWKPSTATQRYGRMARRLKLSSTRLHSLRHYSATELIAAGVDLRTVAGRLGHGSGGATTLRVYSAWSPGADERAATVVSKQLPRPGRVVDTDPVIVNGMALACACGNSSTWTSLQADGQHVSARCAECGAMANAVNPDREAEDVEVEVDEAEPESPYRRIADGLRECIVSGELIPGQELPALNEIAQAHGVALSTAHRAVALLAEENPVIARRGFRAIVAGPDHQSEADSSAK
jgi:integrase